MTLNEAYLLLKDAGIENPLAESRILFAHYSGFSTAQLIDRSINSDSAELIQALTRRSKREPLQYIIGEVDFFKEKYTVTPDCLIPRPDTEILVEYAVKNIPEGETFFDFCTGSGCVAISVLCNTANTSSIAFDISKEALKIAQANADKNEVTDRLTFVECDLLNTAPSNATEQKPFAILSNPPYICDSVYESLEKEIFFEPRSAFLGGGDGLIFYKRLIPLGLELIKDGGFIAFEIGYDQGEALRTLAAENGCVCEIIKDYSSQDRVAVLRKS